MKNFQTGMDNLNSALTAAENMKSRWPPITELLLDHVPEQMNELKAFRDHISPIQNTVDELNDQSARFTANNVLLSQSNLNRLDDLNTRWRLLQLAIEDRVKQLKDVGRDFGPQSQHFLNGQ